VVDDHHCIAFGGPLNYLFHDGSPAMQVHYSTRPRGLDEWWELGVRIEAAPDESDSCLARAGRCG
jgi:hypothetical protein